MNENKETCKRIADEIEAYCDRSMYRCPLCGKVFEWDDAHYNPEESEYTCPECRETYDEDDLEALSVLDYLNDYYGVEYRIDSDGEYKSVEVMVAGGGPSIYIDTKDNSVKLRWWLEHEEYSISSAAANAIDEYFEEQFNAMK